MWLVMRAPFLPMGSLAIWTRISCPSLSKSLIRGTGEFSRRRKRGPPPPRRWRSRGTPSRFPAWHELPPVHRRYRCRGPRRRGWPPPRPEPLRVPVPQCLPRLPQVRHTRDGPHRTQPSTPCVFRTRLRGHRRSGAQAGLPHESLLRTLRNLHRRKLRNGARPLLLRRWSLLPWCLGRRTLGFALRATNAPADRLARARPRLGRSLLRGLLLRSLLLQSWRVTLRAIREWVCSRLRDGGIPDSSRSTSRLIPRALRGLPECLRVPHGEARLPTR